MTNILLLFILFQLCSCSPHREIQFSSKSIDFGTLSNSTVEDITGEFEYYNNSEEYVLIENIVANRSEIKLTWERDTILPGKKGKIHFSLATKRLIGEFSGIIEVYFANQNVAELLTIHVNRKSSIQYLYENDSIFLDKNTLHFGQIFYGEVATDTIHVLNNSKRDWEGRFIYDIDIIKLEQNPRCIRPGEKGKIVVHFNTEDFGRYDHYSAVIYASGRHHMNANFYWPITASVIENVYATRKREQQPILFIRNRRYDFGKVVEGTLIEWSETLENKGESDLIIRNIRSSCGCAVVDIESHTIPPGEQTNLKIQFKTKGRSGFQRKNIIISTNDVRASNLLLTIEGEIERNI